jgi:hypothetical protein
MLPQAVDLGANARRDRRDVDGFVAHGVTSRVRGKYMSFRGQPPPPQPSQRFLGGLWQSAFTVLRWHLMGFAAYWRWKSRSPGGRPRIVQEVRELIRRMSLENPLWGATKIHGELLKLGIEIAQSTVSIYMVPQSDRPLQTWRTFLSNHMEGIASVDAPDQAPWARPAGGHAPPQDLINQGNTDKVVSC